jgi:hypothetical protein
MIKREFWPNQVVASCANHITCFFVSGFDGTLKSGTVLVGQQTFLGLNLF